MFIIWFTYIIGNNSIKFKKCKLAEKSSTIYVFLHIYAQLIY